MDIANERPGDENIKVDRIAGFKRLLVLVFAETTAFFVFHLGRNYIERDFMPKKTHSNSTTLLRDTIRSRGFSVEELAREALIPTTTFFRKLKQPSNFSIGNLRDIYDALSIDADLAMDITAALLWEEK